MLRADFFSTAYHPRRSLPASGMSFEGSRHSVPLGSPMNRAPPLAVSLFLPPVLSNLSSRSVWRCRRCAWRTRTTTGQSIPRAQRTRVRARWNRRQSAKASAIPKRTSQRKFPASLSFHRKSSWISQAISSNASDLERHALSPFRGSARRRLLVTHECDTSSWAPHWVEEISSTR